MEYIFNSLSDLGKVRSINEDAYGDIQTNSGHVFVVCDGMGGHVGGAIASKLAVETIVHFFKEKELDAVPKMIEESIQLANKAIIEYGNGKEDLSGMGTTVLVLIIHKEECYIGHVGDSRIYLYENNKLNRLTKDHSYVQDLIDQGLITDNEAETHPKKNQILKALGIVENVIASVPQEPILVKNGAVFMLCSDGLSGLVNDPSMTMMLEGDDIEISNQILIQAALDSGGTDNITSTLIKITESKNTENSFVHYNPILVPKEKKETENELVEIVQKKNFIPWIIGFIVLAACVGIYVYFML